MKKLPKVVKTNYIVTLPLTKAHIEPLGREYVMINEIAMIGDSTCCAKTPLVCSNGPSENNQ